MDLDAEMGGVGKEGYGHRVLREAMLNTIARINAAVASTPHLSDTRSLLNFAVTDGHSVICTRYVSSSTDEAASLYFSSGTSWVRDSPEGEFKMERRDRGAGVVVVASEPLTFERDDWVVVPTNSVLTVKGQTVLLHPVRDEFSGRGRRRRGLAERKGLSGEEGVEGVEGIRVGLEGVEVGG